MLIATIFKALSELPRQRLVHILSRGYFNVQELTSIVQLSQPTVSHHLKALADAGIVRAQRDGTWSYYTLTNMQENAIARGIVDSFLRAIPLANGESAQFADDRRAADALIALRRRDMHQFFEQRASSWKSLTADAPTDPLFLDQLLALVNDTHTVIELGCGTGSLLERLAPRSGITIGIDYSQRMLDEARTALGQNADKVQLRLGALEHLPAADHSADVVLSHMVLHHIEDPGIVLHEVARVLRPGGLLAIVDLAKHSNELMRQRYGDRWLGFDQQQISSWMSTAGFVEVALQPLGERGSAFLAMGRAPLSSSKSAIPNSATTASGAA